MDKRQMLTLPRCETGRETPALRFLMVLGCGGSMMNIQYRVDLSEAERAQLTTLLNGGRHAVRTIERDQMLLAADAGVSGEVIEASVSVGGSTVCRTKRRFVQGNLSRTSRNQ